MFSLFQEIRHHSDIGTYTTYGIRAGSVTVHYISPDRSFVETLIAQFEAASLAPEHLRDAVEDAIILRTDPSLQAQIKNEGL